MIAASAIMSSGIDIDALAFINAAGITDSTQIRALNNLCRELKRIGIWTKAKAIYPFVGGTASTHKWNLKDPRDLDAAFRLTFNGTVNHASTGVTGDGSTGYYETHLNPGTALALNSAAIFIYSRTNSQDAGSNTVELGNFNGTQGLHIGIRSIAGNYISRHNSTTFTQTANGDSRGFFGITRTASGSYLRVFPASVATASVASVSIPNFTIYGLALNNSGAASNFSTRENAFGGIFDGLTQTESENLRTAVVAFQTTLGRNV